MINNLRTFSLLNGVLILVSKYPMKPKYVITAHNIQMTMNFKNNFKLQNKGFLSTGVVLDPDTVVVSAVSYCFFLNLAYE
jgi:hypothetical protein